MERRREGKAQLKEIKEKEEIESKAKEEKRSTLSQEQKATVSNRPRRQDIFCYFALIVCLYERSILEKTESVMFKQVNTAEDKTSRRYGEKAKTVDEVAEGTAERRREGNGRQRQARAVCTKATEGNRSL